jgi:phosphopantothenoylcysteine decarboxylase/phosphopantothenate--cysteine ligase
VRFIGNRSSGKMGIAIANACKTEGASVTLVIGPTAEILPTGINLVKVQTAAEMHAVCVQQFAQTDIAIMSAAVADYTPVAVSDTKIKKADGELHINLAKTKDILFSLGQMKQPTQLLVGFALETNNEEAYARQKLESKNADIIVLNSLQNEGAGFAISTNCITIFDRKGNITPYNVKPKKAVALDIVNYIIQYQKI